MHSPTSLPALLPPPLPLLVVEVEALFLVWRVEQQRPFNAVSLTRALHSIKIPKHASLWLELHQSLSSMMGFCVFYLNYTQYGSIFISGYAFKNCTGDYGGAIYLNATATLASVLLNSISYSRNTAAYADSTLYLSYASLSYLSPVMFPALFTDD